MNKYGIYVRSACVSRGAGGVGQACLLPGIYGVQRREITCAVQGTTCSLPQGIYLYYGNFPQSKTAANSKHCLTSVGEIRGVHGLDFGFFGPGLRLRPAGYGLRFY